MKILIVGAGGTGGYFGGRLLEVGRDVTFLVRSRRAAQLAETGLVIRSPRGDATISTPPTVEAGELSGHYDLILLSCKAYDLDNAIESFAPGVGPNTVILPVLNGMRHLDVLDARFGAAHVLGGECLIAATLNERGEVLHLNELHVLVFGARAAANEARVKAISELFAGANFVARASAEITLEMWEKWVFLATLAGSTCLLRGAIGDIDAGQAGGIPVALFDECRSIAERAGFAPRPDEVDRMTKVLTTPGSPLTASMLRDVEQNARVEADHVLGDLLARAPEDWPQERSFLKLAYLHLKVYEARRARTSGR